MIGLTLHCRFIIMLDMVLLKIEVANVTMLVFVDVKVADRINSLTLKIKIGSFEVAHWLELRKVAECIDDEVRTGRLISVFCRKLSCDVSSYINCLFHLIFSIALLFELLMYWWRNRWVESYWYKIFLCGNDVFGCFEKLLFAEYFFNVLAVSALSKIC